jgi:hypothetical protein
MNMDVNMNMNNSCIKSWIVLILINVYNSSYNVLINSSSLLKNVDSGPLLRNADPSPLLRNTDPSPLLRNMDLDLL